MQSHLADTDSNIVVKNLSKRYGNVLALDNVSTTFFPGEVHAVLGENGAGKSTLMNVLGGFAVPSGGSVSLFGHEIPYGDPQRLRKLGIELIHQHFMLVPAFTVIENLELSGLGRLGTVLHPFEIAAKATEIIQRLGWELDLGKVVSTLSVGEQQRVEILKALLTDAKVYIFDEPTAVLGPDEVSELFDLLRRLKGEGKTVLLIAHKLSEVLSVADRFTVLRKGVKTGEVDRAAATESQLVSWMVGDFTALSTKEAVVSQGVGLAVSDLTVNGDRGEVAVRNVSFEVPKGEIFGIGGVDGNGQVELAECLAAVRKAASGRVSWAGNPVDLKNLEIGYIPQDRQSDGLALDMSVSDNMLVTGYRKRELRAGVLLKLGLVRAWALGLVKRFDVKTDGVNLPVRSLSGGNQQKVIVGRILDSSPELLIAVNPTRGLDVKAAASVHGQIRAARDAGSSVVLISADLDELSVMADRVGFLSKGELRIGTDSSLLVGGSV